MLPVANVMWIAVTSATATARLHGSSLAEDGSVVVCATSAKHTTQYDSRWTTVTADFAGHPSCMLTILS